MFDSNNAKFYARRMRYVPLIARILFTAIFAVAGLRDVAGFPNLVKQVANLGVPLPELAAALVTLLLAGGTVLIVLGLYARIGALAYLVFLIVVTPVAHRFWGVSDPARAALQQIQFLKNLSLAGGALLLVWAGSGPLSIRRERWRFLRAGDRGDG